MFVCLVQMISIDLDTGEFLENYDIKSKIAKKHPYGDWLKQEQTVISKMPMSAKRLWGADEINLIKNQVRDSAPHPREIASRHAVHIARSVTCITLKTCRVGDAHVFGCNSLILILWQVSMGWSSEDMEMQIADMASTGKETTFCMGDDAPLAVLSDKPHVLYNYFKQRFAQVRLGPPHRHARPEHDPPHQPSLELDTHARSCAPAIQSKIMLDPAAVVSSGKPGSDPASHPQVTNPAIDPLRENLVMSLSMTLGKKANIIDEPTAAKAKQITIESPIMNEVKMMTPL